MTIKEDDLDDNKFELRPEYIKKLNKIMKEKGIKFNSIKELRKIIS